MSAKEDKSKRLLKPTDQMKASVPDYRDEHIATLKKYNELLLFNFGKIVELNNLLTVNNQRLTDMLLELMKQSLNLPS
jgi:hypothetical protein